MPNHTKIIATSGQAHNGRSRIFGLTICKPVKGATEINLRDSLDDTGDIIWPFSSAEVITFGKTFSQFLEFTTGIYVEIIGNIHSITLELGED